MFKNGLTGKDVAWTCAGIALIITVVRVDPKDLKDILQHGSDAVKEYFISKR